MSNTHLAYMYDHAGYYSGSCYVNQDKQGKWAIPADTTLEVPTFKGGYWSKFNGKKWELEKIPTSCAECIEQGFSCISNSPDRHEQEKKAVIESLVNADSENYKTVVNDSFVMSVEEIPEPTEEEKQQKEDEEKDQALEQAIDELGKEMLKAQMCENKEWIAEIKAQYQILMNGEE